MTEENKNLPAETKKQMPHLKVGSRGYLVPDTLESQWQIASIIAQSGMAPKGMERTATLFTAMQLGAEVGLSPMQAIQNIAVINGRPAIWGDAQLALVKAHHDFEYIKERITGTGGQMVATCEVKRKSDLISVQQSFSVEDAKLAGLWGKSGPWSQYPKRMLQMRARSFAIRDAFPDVLKGLNISREEALDMLPDKNGTYVAPTVSKVQEEIEKTKVPENVDKTTGEIFEDPWTRDKWIKLRKAGFQDYVKDNFSTLELQPASVQEEVKAKWESLYGGLEGYPEPIPEEDPDLSAPHNNPDLFGKEPEPAQEDNEPKKKACPDRDGDMIFEDYCNEECPVRNGCPAWD